MKIGNYDFGKETLHSLFMDFLDSVRVNLRGIPKLSGENPTEIATQVIKANAKNVFYAGTGHFRFMWVSDFAKALAGSKKVLSPSYVRKMIDYMIKESYKRRHVTNCFTAKRGFDMPFYRADNLPWLIHAIKEYFDWTKDEKLLSGNRKELQWLIDSYESTHFKNDLISTSIRGDWMDTLIRPSSTYTNICALNMLKHIEKLGLKSKIDSSSLEKNILNSRWRENYFTDYSGTEKMGVDACVIALYFNLFNKNIRHAIIERLESSKITKNILIKVTNQYYHKKLLSSFLINVNYHSSIWLHMGLMYLNGLKKNGIDISVHKDRMDKLIMKFKNIVEVVDKLGKPYKTFFHSSEYGLSMGAGQYLEMSELI